MHKNRLFWRVSALFTTAAGVTMLVYVLIGSSVDAAGVLREPFLLIPLFWLSTFFAVITAVLALIVGKKS
ncbi:MAG: DUF3955 domain-containing protein [Chloroflexi bacterium]|nr:DUF3955 domain-containing protein [Chloroflexota bacterium]